VLIEQLPPESALSTQLRLEIGDAPPGHDHDPETEQWSRTEHLLAAVKDELTALRYSYTAAHSKQRPRWKPAPTPRPGVKSKKKRSRLNNAQVDALAAHLERTQGDPLNN